MCFYFHKSSKTSSNFRTNFSVFGGQEPDNRLHSSLYAIINTTNLSKILAQRINTVGKFINSN